MLLLTTDSMPAIDHQLGGTEETMEAKDAASNLEQSADEPLAKGRRRQSSLRPRTAAIKPLFYRNAVDRKLIRREKAQKKTPHGRIARRQGFAPSKSEKANARMLEEPPKRRIRLRISHDDDELEIKSDVMAEDSGPHLSTHKFCSKEKTSLEPSSTLRPVEGITNNDYCEVCRGDGFFICCEACPKSFHCSCIVPPIESDKLPAESWFCAECLGRAAAALAEKAAMAPKPSQRKAKPVVSRKAALVHFCHFCRKVDPRQPTLQCTRCPLAWHPLCLSLSHSISSFSNAPFVCPAHIPALTSNSVASIGLSPFVLTEHALRMVGVADSYPKHVRVPDWICAYYDEIRAQTQTERCCVGVETDLY